MGHVHRHSRDLSLKWPQGQGLIAAANMNRAGRLSDMEARAMVTVWSSRGCRITSSTLRGNSGSSSKNKRPLCASDTSPVRGTIPSLISTIADQPCVRDAVMRRAEEPLL